MGGGGGKGGAPSNPQLEQSQTQVNNQLAAMLGQQQGQSQQLFNLAFPGMQQADQFYSALASGSPNLLAAIPGMACCHEIVETGDPVNASAIAIIVNPF